MPDTLKPVVSNTSGTVAFEKKITRNLGDFNSVSVTAKVELPVNFTRQDLAQVTRALKQAEALVDRKLEETLEEIFEE